MSHPPIYLASNSPRRRELLKQIHVGFEPLLFRGTGRHDDDINEDSRPGEDAVTYVQRVARAKAEGGVSRIRWRNLPPRLVTHLGNLIMRPPPGIAKDVRARLLPRFVDDVHRLETLLDRDLAAWRSI
ncbi:MAG: Maf family protein [Zoogloea sp.]|nr:Maf family protein [Zoogloea sp.]